MNYLLDTNIISELVKSRPDKNVSKWISCVPDTHIYLSVLSLGEIRKGIEKIHDQGKKEKLRLWLEHELPAWFGERFLAIDGGVAERWGRMLAANTNTVSAIDSLLAATALHYDLTLVTRNVRDFKLFGDLPIVNPWESI